MGLKRYQLSIFATMFLGYACYAYNRKCVSFALPELMEEGLTKEQAGIIVSSQNLAYAISKFMGGVLSDRLSARLLFTVGLVLSGVASVLFGASSNSVALFSAFWFLNGLAQGCGWPSCAKILRKWYLPSQFGTWWSVLSASANISGGVAPFLSAFLILKYGWRFSLTVAGVVSIAMGAAAGLTLVNCPGDVGLKLEEAADKDSGGKAKKEKASSDTGKPSVTDDRSSATVWDLVSSPFLWLVSFSYLAVFCAKTSAVDWGQLYLMDDLKHSQYAGSALTSSIESGGFFGGILAGYLTDWFLHWHVKRGSRSGANPRIPVAVLFMAGAAGCFHLLCFNLESGSSELWISGIGLVLGACLYGPIAIFGVAASESAPAHLSGTSHAIVALAASIGAVISGLPFSIIAEMYNWRAVFILLEVACGITSVALFLGMRLNSRMGEQRVKTD
ncbi:glucose-6-phosphate exchanger SLC37A4-like [Haemaphysalis longicornis]